MEIYFYNTNYFHIPVFYLYSLVDGLDPEDIHDDAELNMTAFGELFADPEKMRVRY